MIFAIIKQSYLVPLLLVFPATNWFGFRKGNFQVLVELYKCTDKHVYFDCLKFTRLYLLKKYDPSSLNQMKKEK